VPRALVIVGSDRRGAVFGAYDISQKIGVSPWYWWADVPVAKRENVFITAGARSDRPNVKYRGFFINDEEPAFGPWARETFGGINAKLYAKVFELNLRLKGNYLWPAMWGKAFAADDPRSMALADEMGVIMGTSHHEPMMRAQDEWHRNTGSGVTGGPWDYVKNAANLRRFWRGGIERMASKPGPGVYESLVTIGMRGDGDEPMTEGTAIHLLERIVADQRRIIADVTGRPASETPQVWALYKEVQDYYDKGMKVPDDVLLLFADDNWGQIRRLPTTDRDRRGGYGVYYHFDYVGGPRNYKWLNTNQIEKVWQQMNLAYERGADDLWIVNVGDIKPMEFPLSFFMDMAWDPQAMTLEAMSGYARDWAERTFGPEHAADIAHLLTTYAKYAARRKPELIDASSFTPAEFERFVREWQVLEQEAAAVRQRLRPEQGDAFFELVQHPILALSNLYRLYASAARGDEAAARAAFARDKAITAAYHALQGGKWNHMMAQTHIGYTGWQQPDADVMPEVAPAGGSASRTPAVQPVPARAAELSIEAGDFTRAVNGRDIAWRVIPNLGVTAFPQGRAATAAADNVRLEYDLDVPRPGDATLLLTMVPTLDVTGGDGIDIGVSIDDGPVQTLRFNLIPDTPEWEEAVRNNAQVLKLPLPELTAGRHTIKVWRIDDNAVLRRLALIPGEPAR
jgi:hypothetical protein